MKKRIRLKSKSRPETPPARKSPRNIAQYEALSEKSKDRLDRVLRVVGKMRSEKLSLKKASGEFGVKPETVKRWAGLALEKRNGRFVARKSDRLLRAMKIPTPDGVREIIVRGSRQASLLGSYWAGVHKFLRRGGDSYLSVFKGRSVKDANGIEFELVTDPKTIRSLGYAGVIRFESIYRNS
jgi:hypothetical protein